ncbi:extracellular solute-binding protein [Solimonas sp. K1W22B-7]|nr:extracellular solute-binding protein [Solimonas sp. K1W22B-7]
MQRRQVVIGGLLAAGSAGLGTLALTMRTRQKEDAVVSIIGEDSSNLQAIARYLADSQLAVGTRSTVEATNFTTASAKAMTAFTQGSGLYDVVLGYNFDLPRYAENHYVFDVGESKSVARENQSFDFEADLLPNVWKELGYYGSAGGVDADDSRPVAYPFSANTMVLVYSKEVFSDPRVVQAYRTHFGRDFAPPRTWQEFADTAKLVAEANKAFKGVVLQGADGGWLYYEWMNFLFGMGGKVMEKKYGWQSTIQTPLTLRTIEAARAADLYLSLKSASAGDFFFNDAVRQRDLMLEHKAAFAIMWTDYIPDLAKAGGFGFAPIPGDRSMIAGGSFFINRKTDVPSACVDLISHLLSKPVQKKLALDGLFPPTRSALSDPEVLAKPYMPAVRQSLERGVYMLEAGLDATLISEKITQALQEAWRGEIPSEAVGSRATELIEARRAVG